MASDTVSKTATIKINARIIFDKKDGRGKAKAKYFFTQTSLKLIFSQKLIDYSW